MSDWHSKYDKLLHITLDLMEFSSPDLRLINEKQIYKRIYTTFRDRLDEEARTEANCCHRET